jgi:hypothetical protein
MLQNCFWTQTGDRRRREAGGDCAPADNEAQIEGFESFLAFFSARFSFRFLVAFFLVSFLVSMLLLIAVLLDGLG